MTRWLGLYLIGMAYAQLTLYVAALWQGERGLGLLYFDPRIGLFFFETGVLGREMYPGLLSWLSVLVVGYFGLALLRGPAALMMYTRFEPVLAVPSLFMFMFVFLANFSPSHGFSRAELIVPVGVFGAASVLPWLYARRLREYWLATG